MQTFQSLPPRPPVLLIDDSPTVRKIIEVALRRAGYEVTAYEDPEEALGALKRGEIPAPALAIVDVGLPKLDGYDVIRLLRASPQFQQLPVIVVSARDGILDRIKARLVGANAYLVKPFKERDLRALVQQYAPIAPQQP